MSVPAQYASIASQALQCVGYHVNEAYVQSSKPVTTIDVQLRSSTARGPTPSTTKCSYNLYLDIDPNVLCPNETKLIQTGISMEMPQNHQLLLHQKLQDYLPLLTIYQDTDPLLDYHCEYKEKGKKSKDTDDNKVTDYKNDFKLTQL